jgi:hypothetical protein
MDCNTADRVRATLEELLNGPIQRVGDGNATLLVALSEAEADALLRAYRHAEASIDYDRTNAAQHGWSRAAIRSMTGAISQIYDAKRRNARC